MVTTASNFRPFDTHLVEFVVDTDGIATAGTTTLDVNGDAMVLPQGFVIDGGYVFSEESTASTTIDVGISGGDTDGLIDGLDTSTTGGAMAEIRNVMASDLPTAKGLANTAETGTTLILTQLGATQSGECFVTIRLWGHFDMPDA